VKLSNIGSANGEANGFASAVLDIDLDGLVDIYIPREARPAELWYNLGDGNFVDVANEYQVQNCGHAKAAAAGDVNGDGYPDLAVAGYGTPNKLFINVGGKYFDESASAAVAQPLMAWQVVLADFNNDGYDDLFFATNRYPNGGESFADLMGEEWEDKAEMDARLGVESGHSRFYLSKGDGTVLDAATSRGLDAVGVKHSCMSLNIGDIDNDGLMDLYMGSGDPSLDALLPDSLLRNVDGESFENVAMESGSAFVSNSHGAIFADLNNDGHQDIVKQFGGPATNAVPHALLINSGSNDNNWIKVSLTGVKSNKLGVGALLQVVDRDTGRSVYLRQGGTGGFGSNPTKIQHVGVGTATRVDITVSWPHASHPKDTYTDIAVNTWVTLTEGQPGSVKTLPLTSFTAEVFAISAAGVGSPGTVVLTRQTPET